MNRFRMGFVGLVFAFAALGVLDQDPTSGKGEIKMAAKKYEFSPNTVRVKKGDHVSNNHHGACEHKRLHDPRIHGKHRPLKLIAGCEKYGRSEAYGQRHVQLSRTALFRQQAETWGRPGQERKDGWDPYVRVAITLSCRVTVISDSGALAPCQHTTPNGAHSRQP